MTDEQLAEQWTPGAVYGFATQISFAWETEPTGRFAALKVLEQRTSPDEFVVVALARLFERMPELDDVRNASVLRNHRGAFNGEPEICRLSPPTSDDLATVVFLGHAEITSEESELLEQVDTSTRFASILRQVELEWRWENERDKYKADRERQEAERTALIAALDAHHEMRLKGLTFATLAAETPFEKWDGPPPYPPEAFTRDARAQVLAAVAELDALGKRPGKRATRTIVRNLIEWFNTADETAHVIETVEREDICETITEMLHVAKHPSLIDEVHQWRTW